MSISFNETPNNVLVPLFYAEMDNSKANTAQISGASLLVGQVLADATIERNKLVLMPSADYARKMCGRGSQLARMVDAYRKTDPFGELYVVAVSNSASGSMATGEVKISGTVTASGAISLYIGSKRVQGVVSADDTALQAAQSLADAINDDPDLPVTARATTTSDDVPVTAVNIVSSPGNVSAGGSAVLSASVAPMDATNKKIVWSSSDPAIIKLDSTSGTNNERATFIAITEGKAELTATSEENSGISDSKTVSVTAATVEPTGVKLDKETASVAAGATVSLTATVEPEDADQSVTWNSSAEEFATVNASGVVTGVAAGEANITATSTANDELSASCAVTVTAAARKSNKAAAAAATGAVVILTAKYAGEPANGLPLALNYYGTVGGEQTPDGLNVTLTAMNGGAGSVDIAPVIAAMGDETFDYIGFPFNDSNSLKMIGEEMNDSAGRWSWSRQIYGHVYTAMIGALTDLVAFGDSFNDQHLTVCGYEEGTQSPIEELIAARLGRQASFLRIDPARPTQTGEITGALPALVGARFSVPERQSLLTHGIATANVVSGVMQIERDITTYKTNKMGVADNSYLDSETLHISAYVIRQLKSVITSKYPRHKLANDGTRFGPGQAIVTPAVIKGEICAAYRAMELDGIVENFNVFKAHLIVERSKTDTNRLNVLFPPDYVNQLRVFAMLNQFRLQYSDEEINANG